MLRPVGALRDRRPDDPDSQVVRKETPTRAGEPRRHPCRIDDFGEHDGTERAVEFPPNRLPAQQAQSPRWVAPYFVMNSSLRANKASQAKS